MQPGGPPVSTLPASTDKTAPHAGDLWISAGQPTGHQCRPTHAPMACRRLATTPTLSRCMTTNQPRPLTDNRPPLDTHIAGRPSQLTTPHR